MKFKRTGFRRMLPIGLLIAAMAGTAQVACAQATASANATAYVAAPLTISRIASLSFGAFVAGPGGTLSLSAVGTMTATGVVLIASANYPYTLAVFTVTGAPNFVYTVTLPTTTVVAGPSSATMTLSPFTSSPASPVTLSAGGTTTLGVGATLTVAAAQAPGAYTGTFNVTITYQ